MKYLYLLLMVVFPTITFGQRAYFVIDGTIHHGIKLIDGGEIRNSRECQVEMAGTIISYNPNEVKEFGFNDGRVYFSKKIPSADSLKSVFLERLYQGEMALYYYRDENIKTFFIEKDSTFLIEIPKQDVAARPYSEQLINLTSDCANIRDACKIVSYNKKSLAELMVRYSQCENKPFPHFRYGFLVGYEYERLLPFDSTNGNIDHFDFRSDGGFSIGLFLDQPISVSDYSVHLEVLYSKHGYSYNRIVESKDLDFVANLSSLRIPLLLRYAYSSNKIRPFFNTGITGTYLLKNETLLSESVFSDQTIVLKDTETESMLSNFHLGYSLGGGVEYPLNARRSLFFELRYNHSYNLKDSEFRGTTAFNVLTGIIF